MWSSHAGSGLDPLCSVKLTSNKQLNPAGSLDLLFKGVTLSLQVSCVPIQNVGVFWVDVNVLEEVVPHEGVVTLWVVSREACGATARLSPAHRQSLPPKEDNRISPGPQTGSRGHQPSDPQSHSASSELVSLSTYPPPPPVAIGSGQSGYTPGT